MSLSLTLFTALMTIPSVPGRVRKWLVPGVDFLTVSSIPVGITEGGTGASTAVAALANLLPIGLGPLPWPTTTAPSGWLVCDGSLISRTTYSALFAVISTTYGAGDGSTTFGLPDGRARTLFGYDSGNATGRLTNSATGGITAAALNNTGGEQSHSQTLAENGPHTHSPNGGGSFQTNFGGAVADTTQAGTNRGLDASTTSSGSGTAHNNVPPGLVVNFIIFAGV